MKMNRCIVLVLPLLFMTVSCGTSAQFAQQRFQDGVYSRPEPVAEAVQIYSKDDFAAMAAANIARDARQKDTVYVVLQNDDWYDSPWFAWGSAWALSWPYRWWAYSSWYDPWYGWARPWYDPWYSWYYDPWYWDPWYYRPHYHHYYWHDHWYRPGLSSDGSHFYGPRFMTQGGGSMVTRPGSSGTRNFTRSYSSSGGNYGSAGAVNIRRGTSAGGGNASSSAGRLNAVRGSSSGSVSRPSGTTNSTVNHGRRPNSNYNYSRSWTNSGSGGASTRSNSYTSPSRSYTSPSRSYSGGSSFSSPSRSYGGGSGGGMRSGGGGNYSRGRR